MYRRLLFLAVAFIIETTHAQGLVNFQNTSSTLVSTGANGQLMNGSLESYYFALLLDAAALTNGNDPNNPRNYTFSGVYATNSSTPGRFSGGASVAVPGWQPGGPMYYEIAGWSADLGHDFNAAWLAGNFPLGGPNAVFGISGLGTSWSGTNTPLDLFEPGNGFDLIGAGFTLSSIPFTLSPPSQTAEAGATVGLGVKGSGTSLMYSWYFNQTNLLSRSLNPKLELTNVQFGEAGTYNMVITNVMGAVTSAPATLQVIAPVVRRSVPGLNVAGQAGTLLNLDYAQSLGPPLKWTSLTSLDLSSPPQYYFDLTLPQPLLRFYRAWQSPGANVVPFLHVHMVSAITLTGNSGDSLRLDFINRFGPTNAWVTVDTVTLTNTSQLYFDVSAIGQPQRLYRLVHVPVEPQFTNLDFESCFQLPGIPPSVAMPGWTVSCGTVEGQPIGYRGAVIGVFVNGAGGTWTDGQGTYIVMESKAWIGVSTASIAQTGSLSPSTRSLHCRLAGNLVVSFAGETLSCVPVSSNSECAADISKFAGTTGELKFVLPLPNNDPFNFGQSAYLDSIWFSDQSVSNLPPTPPTLGVEND
jgi:hypothetical protein